DEPTVGLDVQSRKQFWDTIREFAAKGKTILFSTHYLQEADDIADRIILFNNGKMIADGAPHEIKQKLTRQSVSFSANGDFPKDAALQKLFITDCTIQTNHIRITTTDTDAVLQFIYSLNLVIQDVQIERGSLD